MNPSTALHWYRPWHAAHAGIRLDDVADDVTLRSGAWLRFAPEAALQVDCLEGCAWITFDGDPRDIVLDAGDSATLPPHRRALVMGLRECRVRIVAQMPAPFAEAA